MKWYAISGSWRTIDKEVEKDVKEIVEKIIAAGDGIITGGALGVDYLATQTVLERGNLKKQLRLYLPIKIENFCEHYFRRAFEGVITQKQAEEVTEQLKKIAGVCKECIRDE